MLSVLVAAVLLHGSLIEYRAQGPGVVSNTDVADTGPFSPSQTNGPGQRVAIPFPATAPAAYSEHLLLPPLEEIPASSKSFLPGTRHAAVGGDQACHIARLPGGFAPRSRTHLYCVYRL